MVYFYFFYWINVFLGVEIINIYNFKVKIIFRDLKFLFFLVNKLKLYKYNYLVLVRIVSYVLLFFV